MTTYVALVGGGHIHTPGFVKRLNERAGVAVKYVWDHDPARAQKRAEALNAPVVSDLAQVWKDPEVAAAIVCSETNRHEGLVLAGAAAGKHLFVEKPLGMGAVDSNRMADAIEKSRGDLPDRVLQPRQPDLPFLEGRTGCRPFWQGDPPADEQLPFRLPGRVV